MTNPYYLPELSMQLALLCQQAYQQYDCYRRNEQWNITPDYKLLDILHAPYEKDKLPIGFVAEKNKNIYIIWRGTDNLEEWIQDIKFEQVSPPEFGKDVRIEKGFSELYMTGDATTDSPREICLKQLKKKEGATVFISGHSMGGALATLNAFDLSHNLNIIPVTYTFASPRVGNVPFAHQYNSRVQNSWRVINSYDEVPNLPPKSIPPLIHLYKYSHVNQEYLITFGNHWNLPGNHYIENYISKLKDLCG